MRFAKSATLLMFLIGVIEARNLRSRSRSRTTSIAPTTTSTTPMPILADDEMMDGEDMNGTDYGPSYNGTNGNDTALSGGHHSKMRMIERAKLHIIRIHILKTLGLTQAPNITVPKYDNLSISESKFCYRPSCSIPTRTTDESLWTNATSNVLNLYFNLTSRKHLAGHVKTATLWLHLKAHERSCSCDNQIVISIAYLVKPLKKHQKKPKRMLADVRVLTHQSNSWQSFNIQRAVAQWTNPKKNFGLQIVIRDLSENVINSREIISHIDCSDPNLQIKECVYNSMPAPINPGSNYPLLFIDNETS